MALQFPNGAAFAIASGYGAVKTMSAVSNASTAVATLEASHGVVEGDIIEVTSGWSKLNNRIVAAGTVSTNDVNLSGIDSSSTTNYPAGSGTGSVREISGWQEIDQILGFETSGGDQQFWTGQFINADDQIEEPTVRTPERLVLTLGDGFNATAYGLLATADDDRLQRAFRLTLRNGDIIYYNGIIAMRRTPSMRANEPNQITVSVSMRARPVRYNA